MINRTHIALAASLVAFAFAGSAHAALQLSAGFNESPPVGATIETFNGGTPANLTLNGAQIVNGSLSGQYAAPWVGGPSGGPDTNNYVSVFGGTSASFSVASGSTYFGLLWGSVDTYNTITFYNNGNQVGSLTGQDVVNLVNNLITTGGPGANTNWDYQGTVYANITSTLPFNQVVMSSSGNSFEFDEVATVSAVPLPAALPLFGAALGGIGGFGWWRKRKTA
jgi:hypothetical protein